MLKVKCLSFVSVPELIYIYDLLNGKDSYMQFNESHIPFITFEHINNKEENECSKLGAGLEIFQVILSSGLAVVSCFLLL